MLFSKSHAQYSTNLPGSHMMLLEVISLRSIEYDGSDRIKVSTVRTWRKCEFCGFCHTDDMSKCPRIKGIDKAFSTQAKTDKK